MRELATGGGTGGDVHLVQAISLFVFILFYFISFLPVGARILFYFISAAWGAVGQAKRKKEKKEGNLATRG